MPSDELRYKIFKYIEARPEFTQRELARELGVSLGKTHYCLKALVEKGWVKVELFRSNPDKKVYIYLLTTSGINEKTKVTLRFLKYKVKEYEKLKKEIKQLKGVVNSMRHSLRAMEIEAKVSSPR